MPPFLEFEDFRTTRSIFQCSSKETMRQEFEEEHGLGSLKLEDARGELKDKFGVLEACLCAIKVDRW